MVQLPLSFVAEAKVLAYAPKPAPGNLPRLPVAALSDAELLESLLDPPSRDQPHPPALAEKLLGGSSSPRGLGELLDFAPEHLAALGLAPAAALRLLAAIELGRRLAWGAVPDELPLTDPAAIARYLKLRYASAHQEVMGAILLDNRNRWLADLEIARGTIDRIAVEPRQALVEALRRGATGVVLFHNHPSGDPSPSLEDFEFTRRFHQSCEILGIRLVDHLVLGHLGRWCSIRDRRPW